MLSTEPLNKHINRLSGGRRSIRNSPSHVAQYIRRYFAWDFCCVPQMRNIFKIPILACRAEFIASHRSLAVKIEFISNIISKHLIIKRNLQDIWNLSLGSKSVSVNVCEIEDIRSCAVIVSDKGEASVYPGILRMQHASFQECLLWQCFFGKAVKVFMPQLFKCIPLLIILAQKNRILEYSYSKKTILGQRTSEFRSCMLRK